MGGEDTLLHSEYAAFSHRVGHKSLETTCHCMNTSASGKCSFNLLAGVREPKLGTGLVERQWRDQNQALRSMCCEKGCQRSDLSMLC